MNDFMSKFRRWYLTYWTEITWFIIGWLAMALLEAIGRQQWTTALIDAGLIYINYAMARR
jgi:predicted exporter